MAISDTDHLYLSRAEVRRLLELLREIPHLVEQLAITETRQGKVRNPLLGTPRRGRHMGAQLPLDLDAYLAAEELHNELAGWVRLVAEQRALDVPAVNDVLSAAKWLDRNVIALSLTEGSETALADIAAVVATCRIVIDLPPDDEIHIDPAQLRAANATVLTAYQVEKIATKLGDIGKGLNRDRVRYLAKNGLRECDRDGDTKFYRLGDVLVAHMQHKNKSGKGGSAA